MTVITASRRDEPRTEPAAKRLPGDQIWVLIAGELLVFGIYFLAILFARASDPEAWAHDQTELNANFGAVNTVVLLVSSLFVVLAVRGLHSAAHRHLVPRLLVAAGGCGVLFLAIKVLEYSQKGSHGITPESSDFFLHYFMFTGLHAVHLLIGMAFLVAMYRISLRSDLTRRDVSFFEGGACFWHLVDLLWIVLFPLVFLVR